MPEQPLIVIFLKKTLHLRGLMFKHLPIFVTNIRPIT